MELLPPVLQHQARVGSLPRKLRRLTRHSHPARPLTRTARIAEYRDGPDSQILFPQHHGANSSTESRGIASLLFSAPAPAGALGLLSQSTALRRSVNVHQYVRDQSNLSVPRCQPPRGQPPRDVILRPLTLRRATAARPLFTTRYAGSPRADETTAVRLTRPSSEPCVIGIPVSRPTVLREKRNDEVPPRWFSQSARRGGIPTADAVVRLPHFRARQAMSSTPHSGIQASSVWPGGRATLPTKTHEAKDTEHTESMTHHVVPHRRHGRPGSSSWYPLCHRREVQHHTCAVVPAQRATAPPYRGMGHRTPAARHSSVPQGLPGALASSDTGRLRRSLDKPLLPPRLPVCFLEKDAPGDHTGSPGVKRRILWQLSPGTTARFHALRHSGWRFSRKAQIPSRASSASAFSAITSIA